MEVVLVRHGETEWSRDGRHTGRTDVPLTERGEEQARKVGVALRARSFALVLSSPLQRALETARLAGFSPDVREELREWDYGEYEGRRTAEIRRAVPDWTIWRYGAPGGESLERRRREQLRRRAANRSRARRISRSEQESKVRFSVLAVCLTVTVIVVVVTMFEALAFLMA